MHYSHRGIGYQARMCCHRHCCKSSCMHADAKKLGSDASRPVLSVPRAGPASEARNTAGECSELSAQLQTCCLHKLNHQVVKLLRVPLDIDQFDHACCPLSSFVDCHLRFRMVTNHACMLCYHMVCLCKPTLCEACKLPHRLAQ